MEPGVTYQIGQIRNTAQAYWHMPHAKSESQGRCCGLNNSISRCKRPKHSLPVHIELAVAVAGAVVCRRLCHHPRCCQRQPHMLHGHQAIEARQRSLVLCVRSLSRFSARSYSDLTHVEVLVGFLTGP